ncbi:MAG: hypothetical protein H6825_09895 [Planctomycetes bacterium]|nr:hypothetical protein [Planctomycetota bacterium]
MNAAPRRLPAVALVVVGLGAAAWLGRDTIGKWFRDPLDEALVHTLALDEQFMPRMFSARRPAAEAVVGGLDLTAIFEAARRASPTRWLSPSDRFPLAGTFDLGAVRWGDRDDDIELPDDRPWPGLALWGVEDPSAPPGTSLASLDALVDEPTELRPLCVMLIDAKTPAGAREGLRTIVGSVRPEPGSTRDRLYDLDERRLDVDDASGVLLHIPGLPSKLEGVLVRGPLLIDVVVTGDEARLVALLRSLVEAAALQDA